MDHTNDACASSPPQPIPHSCPDTLLATKFLVPASSHEIIARPHLLELLNAGLHQRLILVSAAAGFGKTTLLADWVRSLAPGHLPVAWVSLDTRDNAPFQFWTYVLTALDHCQPGLSQLSFAAMHDTPQPSWQTMLTSLINSLASCSNPLLLVLDNYEEITEPTVHALLSSLLKHQPPALCIVLATRTDPPLSLARLRAQAQILELRAEQLRASREEMTIFLHRVMDLRPSKENIQEGDPYIQGWWAGMQLAALAFHEQSPPTNLPQVFQRSQPALSEYLVQEVLHRQTQKMQGFLLRTSILPNLCNALCNEVLEQQESKLLLEEIERSNLFLNPLDEQRRWYAYHPLFAEVLRNRLEQTMPHEVPQLHLRASRWYAAHEMHSEAIQQALLAHAWSWAAQLVEQIPSQHVWGRFKDALLLSWIEQLPREVVRERPSLCLAFAQSQFWIAPPENTESWVRDARNAWIQTHQRDKRSDKGQATDRPEAPLALLGEIAALQATLASFYHGDAGATQAFSQEALTHLEEHQRAARLQVIFAQARANISQGNFEPAMQQVQAGLGRIKAEGDQVLESLYLCETVWEKTMAGQLHQAWQLSQQAIQALQNLEGRQPSQICWPYTYQAKILHEWNRLEEAQHLADQAVQLGEQTETLAFLPFGYTVLLQLAFSQQRWEEASKISQQIEYMGQIMSSPYRSTLWSCVDQMRFWLASGNIERARRWVQDLKRNPPLVSPLAQEKQSVAWIRLLLAESQPRQALHMLSLLVERATASQRWYSVLEMWLLQIQAYHMLQHQQEALALLVRAVHLGASEGYIRRFVDEGPIIVGLLTQLKEQKHREEDGLYLATLLHACTQKSNTRPILREARPSLTLIDPLSAREQEVLHLLARGASNQEIAETLIVTIDTIKHHVSSILSKLDVANRTQAVARARTFGLLSGEE